MKYSFLILVISVLTMGHSIWAQTYQKGDWAISFSVGPGFANLRNAETKNLYFNLQNNDGTGSWETLNTDISGRESAASNIPYENSLVKDLRIGLSTALQVEYFIGTNSALQAGVHYDQKGMDAEWSDAWSETMLLPGDETNSQLAYSADFNRHLKNNYLTIPVTFKRYLFNQRFFVHAGGYISFLLSSKLDAYHLEAMASKLVASDNWQIADPIQMYAREFDDELNLKNETNRVDYGLTAGAGYLYPLSDNLALKTELLFNYGLQKIDANGDNDVVTKSGVGGQTQYTNNYYSLNSNAKNIHLAILFGVTYRIGRKAQ